MPKAKNIAVTGTPSKMKKVNMTQDEKRKAKRELGMQEDLPLVLVFGGSQGARTINQTILKLIEQKLNKNYQIVLAAGQKQYDIIQKELMNKNIDIKNLYNSKIVPYIYNMEVIMNACDLAVCRSGAITITEIAIVGKPAIFIPLPNVSQNHQEYNAKVLESRGAAKIILDADLNVESLAKTIDLLIENPKRLQEMGEKARSVSIKNVEEKIYREIKKIV